MSKKYGMIYDSPEQQNLVERVTPTINLLEERVAQLESFVLTLVNERNERIFLAQVVNDTIVGLVEEGLIGG